MDCGRAGRGKWNQKNENSRVGSNVDITLLDGDHLAVSLVNDTIDFLEL
jgi:hypothetical protein